MAPQVIAALIMGTIMIFLSMVKLWRPSEKCMEHEISLPGGFKYKGCGAWGVVLVIGAFIFYVGISSKDGAADNPEPLGFNDKSLLEHLNPISDAHADGDIRICESGKSGWVYMGDGEYNNRWWFTVSQGEVTTTDGSVTQPLVLTAESDRNLRNNHFEDLTGTVLGNILGVKEPDIVCRIIKGTDFLVTKFVQVGRQRVWAQGEVK